MLGWRPRAKRTSSAATRIICAATVRCRTEHGKDKFYSFYRYFLLRLFHEGFGKRRKERSAELEKLLGNIPFLNAPTQSK
jgi:hypothetical protein